MRNLSFKERKELIRDTSDKLDKIVEDINNNYSTDTDGETDCAGHDSVGEYKWEITFVIRGGREEPANDKFNKLFDGLHDVQVNYILESLDLI